MKKTLLLILSIILLLLVSCTNDIEAPDDSWESIFLQYWNEMNTEYVHFSDDMSYDWDSVYEEYLPKFKALDYKSSSDSLKAFRYFKEIAVGIHDNHYNLTVKDGLGNSLSTSPAMLQKYAAAGGDIMDFPDVLWLDSFDQQNLVTINNPDKAVSKDELRKIYEKAIDSFFEVTDLYNGKKTTDTTATGGGGDSVYGYFHSTDGDIESEFPDGAYYGYHFTAFTNAEIAAFEERGDQFVATEWNYVMNAIGIESYFYGVNKDNVFYVYFSDFGNPLYLTDIFTKKSLSKEEEEVINASSYLKLLRQFTRGLFEDLEDIKDETLKAKIEEGLKGILGVQGMYDALNSVTSHDSWKVSNTVTKENINGVIVDLRSNGGGAVAFLSKIWGLFFKEETRIGYVRYKAGYSRLEYTPWTSFSIEGDYTNDELKTSAYEKPVAVIVNGYSVSCSEISCVAAKLLPTSAIVGHTTYGGTCPLYSRDIYNGGPFTSEHLSVYTTTYQFVDVNKNSFETKGITPDIKTELDPVKDNAYIKAVEWVKEKSK